MIKNEVEFMEMARQSTKFNLACINNRKMTGDERVNLFQQQQKCLQEMQHYDIEKNFTRIGTWFTTYSGLRYWPLDPRPQDICIDDIAHALSGICRYMSHLSRFYSVAQHCVLGGYAIESRYAKHFLLHDASEAYLGDIITPIKRLLGQLYQNLEEASLKAIAKKFDIVYTDKIWQSVKAIDNRMLATEVAIYFHPKLLMVIWNGLRLMKVICDLWPQEKAKELFLQRFKELWQ